MHPENNERHKKKKEKNIKDFTTHRWKKFDTRYSTSSSLRTLTSTFHPPAATRPEPRPNNLQRLFPGPREWREGRVAEKKKKKENLYIRLGPTEKMAHAEEKEGLLSRSICCIVVRPPPPSLAAPPEGTITTTGPDDHQVLSTFRVFPHRRRRRLRKNLLPPSHVPRHYSPEISTICVSALRPISLRDPHRFAGEGEEESHLLREANCDLDDFLRPGGGWMGWKQLMLFEEERWEDRFT